MIVILLLSSLSLLLFPLLLLFPTGPSPLYPPLQSFPSLVWVGGSFVVRYSLICLGLFPISFVDPLDILIFTPYLVVVTFGILPIVDPLFVICYIHFIYCCYSVVIVDIIIYTLHCLIVAISIHPLPHYIPLFCCVTLPHIYFRHVTYLLALPLTLPRYDPLPIIYLFITPVVVIVPRWWVPFIVFTVLFIIVFIHLVFIVALSHLLLFICVWPLPPSFCSHSPPHSHTYIPSFIYILAPSHITFVVVPIICCWNHLCRYLLLPPDLSGECSLIYGCSVLVGVGGDVIRFHSLGDEWCVMTLIGIPF